MDILLARRDLWLAVLIRSSHTLLRTGTLAGAGVRGPLMDRTRGRVLVGLLRPRARGTHHPHGLWETVLPAVPLQPRRLVRGSLLVRGLPLLSNRPGGRFHIRPQRLPSSGCWACCRPLGNRTGRASLHGLLGSMLLEPCRLGRGLSLRTNLPTARLRSGPLIGDRPPVGLLGRTRCRIPGHRRPLLGDRRPRRIVARRPLRSRGTTRFRRQGGWFRLRYVPDAKQRAQRDQNTNQNQSAPASHGIIH